MFENNIVISKDLNNAWRDTLCACVKNGKDYIIKRGSYAGEARRQLEYLTIVIEEPWTRPFNFFTPVGIPAPSNEKIINEYFYEYLVTNTKTDKEDYTYATFIEPVLPKVIDMLNESEGNTNQAVFNVGDPSSINLDSPPCLRVIDFKVVEGKLNMSVVFRSWDIYNGLPTNLGGLQLLKEYVLMNLDFPVKDGKLIAYSSGAHVYSHMFGIVNQMNVFNIE